MIMKISNGPSGTVEVHRGSVICTYCVLTYSGNTYAMLSTTETKYLPDY